MLELELLAAVLARRFRTRPQFIGREENPYGHSRSEIITWRLPDGRQVKAFCKQDDDSDPHADVAYEARVYREVLEPLGLSTPAYYGSGVDEGTGKHWILLEYVDGVDDRERGLRDEDAMTLAAGWLGSFHAACERRFPVPPLFLKRYDAAYYAGLANAALAQAEPAHQGWLRLLRDRLESLLEPLLAVRATIVHTDFYDDNVVITDMTVHPLDWEMAAVDLGEADLAFLVSGWGAAVEEACAAAYCAARWPAGAPDDFAFVLKVANLCLGLYKLAANPEDAVARRRRLAALRELAGDLGLLDEAAA
jgi:aminoglycoside phosphotransferase (APT) family kinase protein